MSLGLEVKSGLEVWALEDCMMDGKIIVVVRKKRRKARLYTYGRGP
jgi:hypothetical protein